MRFQAGTEPPIIPVQTVPQCRVDRKFLEGERASGAMPEIFHIIDGGPEARQAHRTSAVRLARLRPDAPGAMACTRSERHFSPSSHFFA